MHPKISVVVPAAHAAQAQLPEVQAEQQVVQSYLDNTDYTLSQQTLYFFALQGSYQHLEGKMLVVGVLANNTTHPLSGVSGRLQIEFTSGPAKAAAVSFTFPKQFMGILQPGQGLLVHFHVPVAALEQNQVFEAPDMKASLSNIEMAVEATEGGES